MVEPEYGLNSTNLRGFSGYGSVVYSGEPFSEEALRTLIRNTILPCRNQICREVRDGLKALIEANDL